MSRTIHVHFLPALFEPADLQGQIAVVIDVLRATTTMVQALFAGASAVVPCGEIDDARRIAAAAAPGSALLGGERGGLKIAGFDLGNSPREYTPGTVGGKRIVFTTTNGTRALIRARQARRILIASLTNLNAVARTLQPETGTIHIVCAGTDGQMTLEDICCAGGIVQRLLPANGSLADCDDATQLAVRLYRATGETHASLTELLRSSRGGRNLIDCGLAADIPLCAEPDTRSITPELFHDTWEVRLA